MVPGAGVEPASPCGRGILSPLRIPVSPPGHTSFVSALKKDDKKKQSLKVRLYITQILLVAITIISTYYHTFPLDTDSKNQIILVYYTYKSYWNPHKILVNK
jgi:hypothetical protein